MDDDATCTPDPADAVFVRLLRELEAAPGAEAAALRRFCEAYPALAGELRAFAATRRLVGEAGRDEADGRIPARLGDFRIERELGVGGMGVVYEAIQMPFGRRVAVKTIRRGSRPVTPALEARFVREQEALARLHHTHIVPIHAAGREGELQYYAMPFIPGAPLSSLIRTARDLASTRPGSDTPSLAELAGAATGRTSNPSSRPGDFDDPTETLEDGGRDGLQGSPPAPRRLSARYFRSVAKVMADAAEAIHHAHEAGVVHRDIKPSNLMVDRDEHCWVVDFGLASLRGNPTGPVPSAGSDPPAGGPEGLLTQGNLGTPHYMAPEQQGGRADARTDVWGLGVTLYELLTLRRAFEDPRRIAHDDPPRPRQLVDTVPADLEAICWKAIRKDPAHRYASARTLAEDLRRWLGHEPVRARPARSLRRLALWSRRNRGWAAAIAAAAVGLAGLGAGGVLVGRARAAAALQRERTERRESLLQRVTALRLAARGDGWSGTADDLLRQAAAIRRDPALRREAVACLEGLDARRIATQPIEPTCLAFDPRDGRVLFGDASGGLHAWSPPAGRAERLRGGPPPLLLGFDPRGSTRAVRAEADAGGAVALVVDDLGAGTSRRYGLAGDGPAASLRALAMTPDGRTLAALSSSADGPARLRAWRIDDGSPPATIPVEGRGPTDVALSDDGRLLALGDDEGRIRVWTLPEGDPVATLRVGRNRINVLLFGPDPVAPAGPRADAAPGRWLLAAGDAEGVVILWDLDRLSARNVMRGSNYDVSALAFRPDGVLLASAGRYEAKVWDAATGRLQLEIGYRNAMHALAFSPDGSRLAIGSPPQFGDPGGVDVWALEDGRGIRDLRGLPGRVEQLAYSADGRLVAALDHGWRVAAWDRATGRLVRAFEAPRGQTPDNAALAFSPDGSRLAVAAGREAVLWDLAAGRPGRRWELPPGWDKAMFYATPDRLLLTRFEAVDGSDFLGARLSPAEHPRIVRVRNLLGPDPGRPISSLPEFNWHVHDAWAVPGREVVIVAGLGRPDPAGPLVRLSGAYDPATGRELWSLPSDMPPDSSVVGMRLDPTGTAMAWCQRGGVDWGLFRLPGREPLAGRTPGVLALGPRAELWLGVDEHADARYVRTSVRRLGRADPLFELGPLEYAKTAFAADGRSLAIIRGDGAPALVDIPELRRRLARLGVGW